MTNCTLRDFVFKSDRVQVLTTQLEPLRWNASFLGGGGRGGKGSRFKFKIKCSIRVIVPVPVSRRKKKRDQSILGVINISLEIQTADRYNCAFFNIFSCFPSVRLDHDAVLIKNSFTHIISHKLSIVTFHPLWSKELQLLYKQERFTGTNARRIEMSTLIIHSGTEWGIFQWLKYREKRCLDSRLFKLLIAEIELYLFVTRRNHGPIKFRHGKIESKNKTTREHEHQNGNVVWSDYFHRIFFFFWKLWREKRKVATKYYFDQRGTITKNPKCLPL